MTLSHILQESDTFDEKFITDIILSNGTIQDWREVDSPTKWHLNNTQLKAWIDSVRSQDHQKIIEAVRIFATSKLMKFDPETKDVRLIDPLQVYGYNSALSDLLEFLK